MHNEFKMRKYLAMVAVPLLLGCGESGKELSDKVSKPEFPVAVASAGTTTTNSRDYCNGPPSISKLFNVYQVLREKVDEGGSLLGHPSIMRMYIAGEREYERARELHDTCKNQVDYLFANQLAINSINFIIEALLQQEEAKK